MRDIQAQLKEWIHKRIDKFLGVLAFAILFNFVGLLWLTIPPYDLAKVRYTGISLIVISTIFFCICLAAFTITWRKTRGANITVTPEDRLSLNRSLTTFQTEDGSINSHPSTTQLTVHQSHTDPVTSSIQHTQRVSQRITVTTRQDLEAPDARSYLGNQNPPPAYSPPNISSNQAGATYVNVGGPSDHRENGDISIPITKDTQAAPVSESPRYSMPSSTSINIGDNTTVEKQHTVLVKAEVNVEDKAKPDVKWQKFPKLKPAHLLKDFQPQSAKSPQSPQSGNAYKKSSTSPTDQKESVSSKIGSKAVESDLLDVRKVPSSDVQHAALTKTPTQSHIYASIKRGEDQKSDSSSVESIEMDANFSSDSSASEDNYDVLNASSIFKGDQSSYKKRFGHDALQTSIDETQRVGGASARQNENAGKRSVYDDALLTPSLISKVYSSWEFPKTDTSNKDESISSGKQNVQKSRKSSTSSLDEEWEKVN